MPIKYLNGTAGFLDNIMDILETVINILKKNYIPPIIYGNEARIKEDLISFFACLTEDVIAALGAELSDSDIVAKLREVLTRAGLLEIAQK